MATVRLNQRESLGQGVPPLCLCCGAPTTALKDRYFTWTPPGLYVALVLAGLGGHIAIHAASSMTHRLLCRIPLCETHQGYFEARERRPLWLILATILLGLLAGAVVTAVALQMGMPAREAPGVGVVAAVGVIVPGILLVVVAANRVGCRVASMSSEGIAFAGVAAEFQQALTERRRQQAAQEHAVLTGSRAGLAAADSLPSGRAVQRATVTLSQLEWQEGSLPLMCVWCGQAASHYCKHNFYGPPKATVWMPVCQHDDDYERHYDQRTLLWLLVPGVLAVVVPVLLAVTGVVPLQWVPRPGKPDEPFLPPFLGIGALIAVPGLVVILMHRRAKALRALKVGSDELVVQGVSEDFALALEAQRRQAGHTNQSRW